MRLLLQRWNQISRQTVFRKVFLVFPHIRRVIVFFLSVGLYSDVCRHRLDIWQREIDSRRQSEPLRSTESIQLTFADGTRVVGLAGRTTPMQAARGNLILWREFTCNLTLTSSQRFNNCGLCLY